MESLLFRQVCDHLVAKYLWKGTIADSPHSNISTMKEAKRNDHACQPPSAGGSEEAFSGAGSRTLWDSSSKSRSSCSIEIEFVKEEGLVEDETKYPDQVDKL